MLVGSRREKKFQPVGNRKDLHPKNWTQTDTIRSNNESEFVVEITNELENRIVPTLKSLCSP